MRGAGAIVAALALAWATAAGAVSTPTALGNSSTSATANTVSLTVGSACPAGDLLAVNAGISDNTQTVASISDSAGNAYNVGTSVANGFGVSGVSGALLTTTLPLSGTVTATFSGAASNARKDISAVCVGGVASGVLDLDGAGATGSSAIATYPASGTVTPAHASEIVFRVINWHSATGSVTSPGTDGNGNAFTQIAIQQATFTSYWDYAIVSSASPISTSATLSASEVWASNLYSFQGAASSGACTGMLTGVWDC